MFRLIRQILEFQSLIGIDLRELIGFIRQVLSLGGPPPVEEEAELRAWLRDLIGVLQELAAETPTVYDDKAVDVAGALLETDAIWLIVHSAIVMIFGRDDLLFTDDEEAALKTELSAAIGSAEDTRVRMLDPLVIIAIIRMIVEFLRHQWRAATQ